MCQSALTRRGTTHHGPFFGCALFFYMLYVSKHSNIRARARAHTHTHARTYTHKGMHTHYRTTFLLALTLIFDVSRLDGDSDSGPLTFDGLLLFCTAALSVMPAWLAEKGIATSSSTPAAMSMLQLSLASEI